MDSVDIIIIGAGVIGLSVASEVAKSDRSVFILEKNDSFGQETSSRNSEVIHAGLYYPPGTMKAVCCLKGRNALYEICPKNNIGIKKAGKLIVATDDSEIEDLKSVKNTAAQNGVELQWLEKDAVKKMESEVSCVAALFSPETGIVDSHALMKYFFDKAKSQGAGPVFMAEVTDIEKQGSQYKVTINNQGEEIEILSTVVINCAGLNADKIASMAGVDIKGEGYEQIYVKGSYFRLSDKYRGKTEHLIYPVPLEYTLGIHTVLDLSGGIRLGPDEEEVPEIDYDVNKSRKKEFFEASKKYLPSIEESDLSADMAGIRPQLRFATLDGFKDFVISHEDDKGLSGFINLIGMESPGLTASPYIGRFVAQMVDKVL